MPKKNVCRIDFTARKHKVGIKRKCTFMFLHMCLYLYMHVHMSHQYIYQSSHRQTDVVNGDVFKCICTCNPSPVNMKRNRMKELHFESCFEGQSQFYFYISIIHSGTWLSSLIQHILQIQNKWPEDSTVSPLFATS